MTPSRDVTEIYRLLADPEDQLAVRAAEND